MSKMRMPLGALLLFLFIFNYAIASDIDKKKGKEDSKNDKERRADSKTNEGSNNEINNDYNEVEDGFWANVNLNYIFDSNVGQTKSNKIKDEILKGEFSLQGLIADSSSGGFSMTFDSGFAYFVKLGLEDFDKHKEENFDFQKLGFMTWFAIAGISGEVERFSDSSAYDTDRIGCVKGTFIGEFGFPLLFRYAYSVSNGDFAYNENRITVGVFPKMLDVYGVIVDFGYAVRRYKEADQKNYYGIYVNIGWDTLFALNNLYHFKVNLYIGPETDSYENIGGKRVGSLKVNYDYTKNKYIQPGLIFGFSYEDFQRNLIGEVNSRRDIECLLGLQTKFVIPFNDQLRLNFCLAYSYQKQESSLAEFDADKNVVSFSSEFKF